ncbi:MAG: hypothetical protein MI741_06425, partial [Rhodospirillales bacterium]|nr:hypothetical protein [Rhodospirillales bacterium]
ALVAGGSAREPDREDVDVEARSRLPLDRIQQVLLGAPVRLADVRQRDIDRVAKVEVVVTPLRNLFPR